MPSSLRQDAVLFPCTYDMLSPMTEARVLAPLRQDRLSVIVGKTYYDPVSLSAQLRRNGKKTTYLYRFQKFRLLLLRVIQLGPIFFVSGKSLFQRVLQHFRFYFDPLFER